MKHRRWTRVLIVAAVVFSAWTSGLAAQSAGQIIAVSPIADGATAIHGFVDVESSKAVAVVEVTIASKEGAFLDRVIARVSWPEGQFTATPKAKLAAEQKVTLVARNHKANIVGTSASVTVGGKTGASGAAQKLAPTLMTVANGATSVKGVVDPGGLADTACVVVTVKGKKRADGSTPILQVAREREIGTAGSFVATLTSPLAYSQTVVAVAAKTAACVPFSEEATVTVPDPPPSDELKEVSTPDTRMTTGLALSAASATAPSANYFVDFMLSAPVLGRPRQHIDGSRHFPGLMAWANVRLIGMPQQVSNSVKQISTALPGNLAGSQPTGLVQGLSVVGGIEIRLGRGARFGDGAAGHYVLEPTAIVGFGATTPVDPASATQVFVLTDAARAHYGVDPDKKQQYLALVQPDRSRFLREWRVGVRLKTHHFDGTEGSAREVNFPGLVDVTFGMDESISGGGLRHWVLATEGFYPLPVEGWARSIYVFGQMRMGLRKFAEVEPLLLAAPSAAVPLDAKELVRVTVPQSERGRDQWKFGVGLDLVTLINAMRAKPK